MDCMYPKLLDYLGTEYLEIPEDRERDPYSRALWLWKELQHRASDEQTRRVFRSFLSEPQLISWRILDDWWNGGNQKFKPDDSPATVELLKAEERRQ